MVSVPAKEAAEELCIVGEASAAEKAAVDVEKGESTKVVAVREVCDVICLIFYFVSNTDDYTFFLFFFNTINTFRYHQ